MIISVSRLKTFKACRRMYELKYIHNLEPVQTPEALETGPLRTEEYVLAQSVFDLLDNTDLNGVPRYAVEDVLKYYFANLTDDTPWVVLPVESFDAYYGNTNFSRKWLSKLPKEIITREYHRDVSRISANILRMK